MKWLFALLALALVCDLAADDPMRLRSIDLDELHQTVRNFADHLCRAENRDVLETKSETGLPRH